MPLVDDEEARWRALLLPLLPLLPPSKDEMRCWE
jgi:hypothetical protein